MAEPKVKNSRENRMWSRTKTVFYKFSDYLTDRGFSPSRHLKTWAFLSLLFIAILVAVYVPRYQIYSRSPNDLSLKERSEIEDTFRRTTVQFIGGIALALGLFLTYRRIRASERQVETMASGQITDRLTRAIDQLGSTGSENKPNIEIRLGGIYALEQIAKEQPDKYHWVIMEILTAYLRRNRFWFSNEEAIKKLSPEDQKRYRVDETVPVFMRPDVQAICTIIGRRNIEYDKKDPYQYLNLSNTNLWTASFLGARLWKVTLGNCNLKGADFKNAELLYVPFSGTDLDGAILQDASFFFTDLRGVRNLTITQLCEAKTLYKSIFDPELEKQVKEKCPHLLEEPKHEK